MIRDALRAVLAASLLAACAVSEPYPVYDEAGHRASADPDSCLASVAARRYVHEMRAKLLQTWVPPPGHRGIASVDVVILLGPGGELKQLYVAPPEDPVKESAIAAFHGAAPFGEIPSEASCLTEQTFRAEFQLETR